MCLSLRYFFPFHEIHDPSIENQEEPVEDPVMRKGSLPPVNSRNNISLSESVDSLETIHANDSRRSSRESTDSSISSISDVSSDAPSLSNVQSSPTGSTSKQGLKTSSTDSKSNLIRFADEPSTSNDAPPTKEYSRRSSFRRMSSDYKGVRRVSFHEDVNVRVYPLEDDQSTQSPVAPAKVVETPIDNIDQLTVEVSNRISRIKAKDAPTPSLEDLVETLSSTDMTKQDASGPQPSTSKFQESVRFSKPEMTFDEIYPEMDVYMRNSYPKYYHFLKTHMISAAEGTEDYSSQVQDFKEAIVGCKQYPAEYFEDLERSIAHYERVSGYE